MESLAIFVTDVSCRDSRDFLLWSFVFYILFGIYCFGTSVTQNMDISMYVCLIKSDASISIP